MNPTVVLLSSFVAIRGIGIFISSSERNKKTHTSSLGNSIQQNKYMYE